MVHLLNGRAHCNLLAFNCFFGAKINSTIKIRVIFRNILSYFPILKLQFLFFHEKIFYTQYILNAKIYR
jgi:hypothetical protein